MGFLFAFHCIYLYFLMISWVWLFSVAVELALLLYTLDL